MTFTKTYAISRMEKGASLVGSVLGPALAVLGVSFWLMSYAATHAWQVGASQMGYFWQSVGEYPYFVQAIWPTLTSFWQTSALTLVMLVLGLGGAYLTFSDFKRRKWVRGAFRLALSMLAVAFVIFAMSSSVVLAASPTSGPVGQSVDTGYGTSCSASFCVFTNTVSGTKYYYAMVGLGYSSGSSCALTAGCQAGQIAFGGPGNAGGATGTSSSTVINAAIAAIPWQLSTGPSAAADTEGSSALVYLSGTIALDAGISISRSFIDLRGFGRSTILSWTGSTPAITVNAATGSSPAANWYVKIEDMYINTGSAAGGILLTDCHVCQINGVEVLGPVTSTATAIDFEINGNDYVSFSQDVASGGYDGFVFSSSNQIVMSDVYAGLTWSYSYYFSSCSGVSVYGATADTPYGSAGFQLVNTDHASFYNPRSYGGNASSFVLYGDTTQTLISGGQITPGTGKAAFYIVPVSLTLDSTTVEGVSIDMSSSPSNVAFWFAGTGTVSNFTAIGNHIISGRDTNIYIESGVTVKSLDFEENNGINPIGKMTSAWASATVGLGGTLSYPHTSGTTYTINGVPLSFSCSGGGTVSIAFKDASGNTVASGLTCSTLTTQFWPVGYTITVSNTTAITMAVFGD